MQSMFAQKPLTTEFFLDLMQQEFKKRVDDPLLMLTALLKTLPNYQDFLKEEKVSEASKEPSSETRAQQVIQCLVEPLENKKITYPLEVILLLNAFFSYYPSFFEKLSRFQKPYFLPVPYQALWNRLWPKKNYLQEMQGRIKQLAVIPLNLALVSRVRDILKIMSHAHTDDMWMDTLRPLVSALEKNALEPAKEQKMDDAVNDESRRIVEFFYGLIEKIPSVYYPMIIRPLLLLFCKKEKVIDSLIGQKIMNTLVHFKDKMTEDELNQFCSALMANMERPLKDGVNNGHAYIAIGNLQDKIPQKVLVVLVPLLINDVKSTKGEAWQWRKRLAMGALASLASKKAIPKDMPFNLSDLLMEMLTTKNENAKDNIELVCEHMEEFAPMIPEDKRLPFLGVISYLLNAEPKMFTNDISVIMALKVFGQETPKESIPVMTAALLKHCENKFTDVFHASLVWKTFGAKIPDQFHDKIIKVLMSSSSCDNNLLDLVKVFDPKYAEMIVNQLFKQLEEKEHHDTAVRRLGQFSQFIPKPMRSLVVDKLIKFSEGADHYLASQASDALIRLSSVDRECVPAIVLKQQINALFDLAERGKYPDGPFTDLFDLLDENTQSKIIKKRLNFAVRGLRSSSHTNRAEAMSYLQGCIPDNPNEFLGRFPLVFGRMGAELGLALTDMCKEENAYLKSELKLTMFAFAATIQTFHDKLTEWYHSKAQEIAFKKN